MVVVAAAVVTSILGRDACHDEHFQQLWWWWRLWRRRLWRWRRRCVDGHFRVILNFKKTNCHYSGDRQTDRHTDRQKSLALGNDPPSVRAYAPTRSSKSHPRAPPPDPRLKPGPVFVASGGVITVGCGVLRCVAVRVGACCGALRCVVVCYGALRCRVRTPDRT